MGPVVTVVEPVPCSSGALVKHCGREGKGEMPAERGGVHGSVGVLKFVLS